MKDDTEDRLWKALADPARRRALDLLKEGARSTGELCAIIGAERGLSRFAVMKHLGVLEAAGLLIAVREGKFRKNYLNAAPFIEAYRRWVSAFAELPATAALGLKAYLESGSGGPEEDP